jgi:hypothetical protein
MQVQVYTESGKEAFLVEVPKDVLEAAKKVYEWLTEHRAIELHGLRLA